MKANDKIDAARVDLMLSEPRLSGVKLVKTSPSRLFSTIAA